MFWQTGRQAVPPDATDPEAIDQDIDRLGIAYLLIDDDRYANAGLNPLSRFVTGHPDRVHRVWSREAGAGSIAVFRRAPGPPGRRRGRGVAVTSPAGRLAGRIPVRIKDCVDPTCPNRTGLGGC